MENSFPIFPIFLFPNIEYLSLISKYGCVLIEERESFPKQSFRNRFYIYSASGSLPISIPIIREKDSRLMISDVKISYKEKWNIKAWRAIESGYGKSSYFEYFSDEIKPFFFNEYERLVDLNYDVLYFFLKKWGINTNLEPTRNFHKPSGDRLDFRYNLTINKYKDFKNEEYFQCFSQKYGFINNLSCLDLLFNEGKEGRKIIYRNSNT